LESDIKKILITIPTDLNGKWNSVRDNADVVSALIEDSNKFTGLLNELDDKIYDRQCEIEHLQEDLENSIDNR
jgi:hypothetical protein